MSPTGAESPGIRWEDIYYNGRTNRNCFHHSTHAVRRQPPKSPCKQAPSKEAEDSRTVCIQQEGLTGVDNLWTYMDTITEKPFLAHG